MARKTARTYGYKRPDQESIKKTVDGDYSRAGGRYTEFHPNTSDNTGKSGVNVPAGTIESQDDEGNMHYYQPNPIGYADFRQEKPTNNSGGSQVPGYRDYGGERPDNGRMKTGPWSIDTQRYWENSDGTFKTSAETGTGYGTNGTYVSDRSRFVDYPGRTETTPGYRDYGGGGANKTVGAWSSDTGSTLRDNYGRVITSRNNNKKRNK